MKSALRSGAEQGGTAQEPPWSWIVDVELVPKKGSVYSKRVLVVHRAAQPIMARNATYEVRELATVKFRNLGPGESYRILVTERDPAVPLGCPAQDFKTVLGEFATPTR